MASTSVAETGNHAAEASVGTTEAPPELYLSTAVDALQTADCSQLENMAAQALLTDVRRGFGSYYGPTQLSPTAAVTDEPVWVQHKYGCLWIKLFWCKFVVDSQPLVGEFIAAICETVYLL